jgi:hypothetical protein
MIFVWCTIYLLQLSVVDIGSERALYCFLAGEVKQRGRGRMAAISSGCP